jgi:hypothetical protein
MKVLLVVTLVMAAAVAIAAADNAHGKKIRMRRSGGASSSAVLSEMSADAEVSAFTAEQLVMGTRNAQERQEMAALAGVQAHETALAAARTGVYDANVHPHVCAHMNAWMTANIDGAAAPAQATFPAVFDAWSAAWTGLGPADAARHGIANAVAHPAGREIIRTVRFRNKRARATVCLASALQIGALAYAAVTAAGNRHNAYTLGVELELSYTQVKPDVNGNVVRNLAVSGMLGAPGSLFGAVPWLRFTSDHSRHGVDKDHMYTDTIVEVNVGPLDLSPANDDGGGATHTTLTRVHAIVDNTKEAIRARSTAAGVMGVDAPHCYGAATLVNVLNTLNAANQHVIAAAPAAGGELDLAAQGGPWTVAQCRHQAADDAKMQADTYLQANYMMPVSGVPSSAWLQNHPGENRILANEYQFNVVQYTRKAAVDYLTDVLPAAEREALSAEQRGDLLGLFHTFYHQYTDTFFSRHSNAYLGLADDSTRKNLFYHMIKTNVDAIVKKLDPELADVVHNWYLAMNFGAGALDTNENLRKVFRVLRAQFRAAKGKLESIALSYVDRSPGKVALWGRLRQQLEAFDGLITCVDPVEGHAAPAHPCSTSMIGQRAPPASRVDTGAGGDGVLSVVVESRDAKNKLSAAVKANNAANTNAAVKAFLRQHTWTGKENWVFADYTLGV